MAGYDHMGFVYTDIHKQKLSRSHSFFRASIHTFMSLEEVRKNL